MIEQFEIFDEWGRSKGLMPRPQVHLSGEWHKATQVFVYNSNGELLLQRRSSEKDLFPNCWDSSVGEHLKPGESYLQGAVRGVSEELGIVGVELLPVGGERRLRMEGGDYLDYEMQQAFCCQYDGVLVPQREEVAELKWVDRHGLDRLLAIAEFTPWFHHHRQSYDLFSSLS